MLRILFYFFHERQIINHNGLLKGIQKNLFTLWWSGWFQFAEYGLIVITFASCGKKPFFFVCLFVGWLVCLIFYLLSIFAYGLSVHAMLNQMVQYPQILNYYFLCVLPVPAQNRLQNIMGIIVEKDTQNVSMTLAWVILS
jgi:hypothetical protein